MKKSASAQWHGNLRSGKGSISTETGILDKAPYGFNSRFEDGPGTNPEELIGAAHAGCFSMALSMMLGDAGHEPDRIDTRADVTLDKTDDGFVISAVHLSTVARVPGIDDKDFQHIADQAGKGCPVSKLLKGADITLDARLDT